MSTAIKKYYVKPLTTLKYSIMSVVIIVPIFILNDLSFEYLFGNKELAQYLLDQLTSDYIQIMSLSAIVIGYIFFQFNFTISIENEYITGMTTSLIRRKYLLKDLILHKENRFYLILKRRNSDWFMLHIPKFIENYDECYKNISKYVELDKNKTNSRSFFGKLGF